jgi:hypothetical protein
MSGRQLNFQKGVEGRVPLGVLGCLAHTALVKRQLQSIFGYRARELAELFV